MLEPRLTFFLPREMDYDITVFTLTGKNGSFSFALTKWGPIIVTKVPSSSAFSGNEIGLVSKEHRNCISIVHADTVLFPLPEEIGKSIETHDFYEMSSASYWVREKLDDFWSGAVISENGETCVYHSTGMPNRIVPIVWH